MTKEVQLHELFTIARPQAELAAAWRGPARMTLEGDPVAHDGEITFREATGDRGTVIGLSLRYEATEDDSAPKVATVIGKAPAQEIREEMRRFKQLMEAGEIPTVEGQSSGRAPEEGREKA